MKRLFIKLWFRLNTFFNFNLNKKVRPRHLLLNQLQKHRAIDMKNVLNKQIDSYLSKSNNKERFVLVEIGSYLGESLDLWGDILEKKLDNNFLIISIDPFTAYVSESDKNWRPDKSKAPIKSGAASKMSKVIEKIYMYFIHNISLKKWRDKHIHLRMKSREANNIIKSYNIQVDFCYIDGCHYYEDFKFDLENYSELLRSVNEYKGIICGDDYEASCDELLEKFEKKDLDKILNANKTTDCLIYDKFIFHPGITLAMSETKVKIKKFASGFFVGSK